MSATEKLGDKGTWTEAMADAPERWPMEWSATGASNSVLQHSVVTLPDELVAVCYSLLVKPEAA